MKYTFTDFVTERVNSDPDYYRSVCRHCGARGPTVSNVDDPVQAEFHRMLGMVLHGPNCALLKAVEYAG